MALLYILRSVPLFSRIFPVFSGPQCHVLFGSDADVSTSTLQVNHLPGKQLTSSTILWPHWSRFTDVACDHANGSQTRKTSQPHSLDALVRVLGTLILRTQTKLYVLNKDHSYPNETRPRETGDAT